jgi:hypothetical protein
MLRGAMSKMKLLTTLNVPRWVARATADRPCQIAAIERSYIKTKESRASPNL